MVLFVYGNRGNDNVEECTLIINIDQTYCKQITFYYLLRSFIFVFKSRRALTIGEVGEWLNPAVC